MYSKLKPNWYGQVLINEDQKQKSVEILELTVGYSNYKNLEVLNPKSQKVGLYWCTFDMAFCKQYV